LYIGRSGDFDGGAKVIEKITFLDGSQAIWLAEKQ